MSAFGSQSSGSPFSFSSSSQQPSSSTLPFSFSNPSAPKNPTPLFNSFGADSSSSYTATEMAVDSTGDNEADVDELYLEPAAFSAKDKAKWKASGRGFLAAVSPVCGEVAAWVTKKSTDADKPPTLKDNKLSIPDRTVYFATLNKFPDAVQSVYADTYTLFISLQRIIASSMRLPVPGSDANGLAEVWDNNGNLVSLDGLLGPPGAETIVHMRRLVDMYLEEVAKLREADMDEELKLRWESVYHIFNLAEILYLPQDGRGEGLLGEELLDWVNAVDTIHVNTQGNEIMQTKKPWEHPLFWPFVNQCLLRGFFMPASSFLRTLSSHPHPPIAKLGVLLSTQVSTLPRSTNTAAYALDHQFLSAHKQWLARFRAEFASFLGGRGRGHWLDNDGSSSRSEWSSWEDDFRAVVELMEGKPERLFEECADWREAVGAWGVLVDVGLRRDDLPGVMKRIVDHIPVDSTIMEDAIQSSLCMNDVVKALMGCHDLDLWLAAHLADVFDKLALIPDDEERFETSLRDYFLLEYTEMLQESPSAAVLWRVIAEYLNAAGDEGRNRLREYIVHVNFGFGDAKGKDKQSDTQTLDDMDVEGNTIESQFQHFAELQELCLELKLDEELRTILTVMAERLIRTGEYGIAATMALSAEDGYTLTRIAEKILNAYVEHGEREFLRLVESLPPTILHEAPLKFNELQLSSELADGTSQTTMVMFAARLAFLSEFRDYLLYLREGDRSRAAGMLVSILTMSITPIEYWAVLLAESVDLLEDEEILFSSNDTFELMRVLEEVLSNATFAPNDYLRQLWRYLQRQEKASVGDAANGITSKTTTGPQPSADEVNEKDATALALSKLEVVRLALARNLSRAVVAGFETPF